MANDEPIEFGPWEVDAVSFTLGPADPGEVRSAASGESVPLRSKHEPRVALPASTFGCVTLDALKDHPAIDDLLRAEMAEGASFRMLRFPLSLRGPEIGRITEARYAVRLTSDDTVGPTVRDIYPRRLEGAESEITTKVAFEPKLSIGKLVDFGGGTIGRSVVIRQARAMIIGFWSESGAEWELRSPDSDEGIEGVWEFLVVVRWPRAVAPLRLSVAVSAVVATARSTRFWRTRQIERNYEAVSLEGCIPAV
jgi:hypothetical protein